MADSLNLRNALGLDGVSKLFDGSRVVAATEHEVLPNKNTELVAGIVENVLFPNTTTPDSGNEGQFVTQKMRFRLNIPYHDLVTIDHSLQP